LFTDNRAGVNGTDCGYSIPMGSRTLWMFGDVFLQDPKSLLRPFMGAVSNCGLLVQKGRGASPLAKYTFLTGQNGVARQLIPLGPGEGKDVRLWPFGGWFDASNRQIYLYYDVVKTTGNGLFDFLTVGYGLCRLGADDIEHASFERLNTQSGNM